MEERNLIEENISTADIDMDKEIIPKARSKKYRDDFHKKECKVIRYNKAKKTLDVYFDTYGIRLKDVENFPGDSVIVKYKGEIGKPNFKVGL